MAVGHKNLLLDHDGLAKGLLTAIRATLRDSSSRTFARCKETGSELPPTEKI